MLDINKTDIIRIHCRREYDGHRGCNKSRKKIIHSMHT